MLNLRFSNQPLTYLLSSLITSTSLFLVQPVKATTLSLSGGFLNVQFSQTPHLISTKSTTETKAISGVETNSLVEAKALGSAFFLSQSFNPLSSFCPGSMATLCTLSSSQAYGNGSYYVGEGKTKTEAIGSFFVNAGTTFSFAFLAHSYLETITDNFPVENANAYSKLSWQLYDNQSSRLLDSVEILGKINTYGNNTLKINSSTKTNGSLNTLINHQNYQNDQIKQKYDFSQTLVQGSYSRFFSQPTTLTFVSKQESRSVVKVNEPKNNVALIWLIIMAMYFIGLSSKKQNCEFD